MKTFMESKGLTYHELDDVDWLEKLHFMVHMTNHLKILNITLQGKGCTPVQMLEDVLAFERKKTLCARDIQKNMLSHLKLKEEHKSHKL